MYSSGVMTSLGSLNGLAYSTAVAVNDSGLIVGTASNNATIGGSTITDPFVYDSVTHTMYDLNLSTYAGFQSLETAVGINQFGQVIGEGLTTSGAIDAYVLNFSESAQPTPEPSSIISMALGLLLCAAWIIRAKRQQAQTLVSAAKNSWLRSPQSTEPRL